MPTYDDSLRLADALRGVFPKADLAELARILGAGEPSGALPERVQVACVLLSAGDLGKLRHYIAQAQADARDVLYWAFYYGDEAPAHMKRYLRR